MIWIYVQRSTRLTKTYDQKQRNNHSLSIDHVHCVVVARHRRRSRDSMTCASMKVVYLPIQIMGCNNGGSLSLCTRNLICASTQNHVYIGSQRGGERERNPNRLAKRSSNIWNIIITPGLDLHKYFHSLNLCHIFRKK